MTIFFSFYFFGTDDFSVVIAQHEKLDEENRKELLDVLRKPHIRGYDMANQYKVRCKISKVQCKLPEKTSYKSSFEFSLNCFCWIHWIQWILAKSKSSMVTRDSPYLITDIFLQAVVKKKFPLLSLVRDLFKVVSGNRYVTRGSNGNILSITLTGNESVAR